MQCVWMLVVILGICFTVGIPILQHVLSVKNYKKKTRIKTPLQMLLDCWCDGCDEDFSKCQNEGRCLGCKIYKEDKNEEESV